jgi:hypothetical protein
MTASFHLTGQALWDRMNRAVERVQERFERAVHALRGGGVPFAVVGGHAVRAWVAQIDEAAVRTTRDVDLLIRRPDWIKAQIALEDAGFVYQQSAGAAVFLDAPDAKARDAIHILFAGEKGCSRDLEPLPDPGESQLMHGYPVAGLEALVRMKLSSFRTKDRMHLVDMIDVELVDASWCQRLPAQLATRLQNLLDYPDG